jgi:hypothetical protein
MKTTTLFKMLQAAQAQRRHAHALAEEAAKLMAQCDTKIKTLADRIRPEMEALGIITPHDCSQGGTRRIYHGRNLHHAIMDVLSTKGNAITAKEVIALVHKTYPDRGYATSSITQTLWVYSRPTAPSTDEGKYIRFKMAPADHRLNLYYKSSNPEPES